MNSSRFKNIALCLLMTLISACAKKKSKEEKKTTAKFVLSIGVSNYPGGIYVAAYNTQNGQKHGKVFHSDSDTFTVPNGQWKFSAMGWKGPSVFEGDNLCDLTDSYDLNGEPITIDLKLTKKNCDQKYFGDSVSRLDSDKTQFKNLRVQNCMGLKELLKNNPPKHGVDLHCDGSDSAQLSPGLAQSYKIELHSFSGSPLKTIDGYTSTSCQEFRRGEDRSPFKIPLLSDQNHFPMHFKLKIFSSSSCQGEKEIYHFAHGLGVHRGLQSTSGSFMEHNSLYTHSNYCQGASLTDENPHQLNHGEGIYEFIVCNESQLASLEKNSQMNKHAIISLGQSLDLSKVAAVQIPQFNGIFKGNGHTLKNAKKALFNSLYREGTIQNLRVEGARISGSDQSVLINRIEHGSDNLGKVKISNVEIINSNISSDQSRLGILIGEIKYDSNNITDTYGGEILIERIKVKNNDGSKVEGSGEAIGGLIGHISSHSPMAGLTRSLKVHINEAEISTSLLGHGSKYIGGAIGQIEMQDSADVLGEISLNKVSYLGEGIIGQEIIGGMIGSFSGSPRANLTINMAQVKQVDHDGKDQAVKISCSALSTKANCGGIIGEMLYGSITNSFTHHEMVINPQKEETTNYAGLCGECSHCQLNNNSIISVLFSESNGEMNFGNVGGVVASMKNSSISDHSINLSSKNLKASVFGGIAGFVGDKIEGSLNDNFIKDNVIKGSYQINRYTTQNKHYIGSMVGVLNFATLKNNISYMNLESNDQSMAHYTVGGLVGMAGGRSDFNQSILGNTYRGSIHLGQCQKNIKSGMAVGILDNSFFRSNFVAGEFNFQNGASVKGSCGFATGEVLLDSVYSNQFDTNSAYVSSNQNNITGLDGDQFNQWSTVGKIDQRECETQAPTLTWDQDISMCITSYEQELLKFGDHNQNGELDLAGNYFEPFKIESIDQWNLISDNSIYLTKSFELRADLDFEYRQEAFIPIGGMITAESMGTSFTGNLLNPQGHKLKNILLHSAVSADNIGIIRQLGKLPERTGVVGTLEDPLIVEGLKIDYQDFSPNYLGGIGLIQQGLVSLHISQAEYSGTGAAQYVGGIAGGATQADIQGSLFQGKIGPESNSQTQVVAGVIGRADDLGSGQRIKINIDQSGTLIQRGHAGSITGPSVVGGMIGVISDKPADYSILRSYSHFQNNNQLSASMIGGMIGLIGDNTQIASQLKIKVKESLVYRPAGSLDPSVRDGHSLFNYSLRGLGFKSEVDSVVLAHPLPFGQANHGLPASTDRTLDNDLKSIQSEEKSYFVWLSHQKRFGLFFEE